jgi:hypothetical protein
MTTILYFQCFAVAFFGMVLQALLKIKSIQEKARKANVAFKAKEYLVDDWVSHCASLTTVVLFLFFIDEIAHFSEHVMNYVKFGFAFVGYTGSDIMSRIFSVVNKRINNAIDYKTSMADEASGTTDKPTPAK